MIVCKRLAFEQKCLIYCSNEGLCYAVFVLCDCVFCPQYMSKVEPWCKACGEGELPSELQDLEDTIHHHQGLYEHITTAYSEASRDTHTYIFEYT